MILVTGGSGFVGRSLLRTLRQQGRPVRAYTGRMNDPLQLRKELEGVEVVFHLASAEARGRARLLQHVDVEGSERLLEEGQRAGIAHLVVMSRLRADPHSLYPLLRAKGKVEQLVRRRDIPYTIVRSATLFGMEDRFLNVIAGLAAWTWPFVWLPGGGDVVLQPLWLEDLVRCLVGVLERPELRGETVTVAADERLRYRDVVNYVLEAAALQRRPLKVDLRLVRALAKFTMGLRQYPPVTGFFLDRFSMADVAPIDSVLRTFGFRPERMVDHIAYLRRPGLRRRLFLR